MALALTLTPAALAHVEKRSGSYSVAMGWGNEPPVSNSENFVDVTVTDASGAPVETPAGALQVEVSFGGEATTLPLVPGDERGQLRAAIVPTRPGTYGFRVRGTIDKRAVETEATCSESTFECVTDAAAIQFPARDPAASQIAERIERESARAQSATDRADSAHTLAVIAIVVAVAALAAAVTLALRGRRRSP